jgi:phospholipid/cholesterol/gamma-HCH transport system permease protein
MSFLAVIGEPALRRFRAVRFVMAVIWSVLRLSVQGRSWTRSVRTVMARQILFTGVDAIGFTAFIAVLAGISIVVQAQLWSARIGQAELLGPLLITVVVREVGPLLVNLIVVGRSGTAIASELAGMRVRQEVALLDSQGVDPSVYLVMPRVLALSASVLCLTVWFVLISFGTGYVCGLIFGTSPGGLSLFVESVVRGIKLGDFATFLAKTLVPALATSTICCIEGLSVEGATTDVPQAVTRSVTRSNATILLVSVIVSVLSYG